MRECLYAGEEGQVERAGDLDGLQCEGGRVEGERDWVNHLGVHQQLGALAAVSQTRLEGRAETGNINAHSFLFCEAARR